ncbi:MAG: hypothetical protein IIW52_01975 [Alistipes sp.]|nr:hypothetical protein [Alistipes sp.]
MKTTNIFTGTYTAPDVELFTAPVESGFAASLDGGINDWIEDDDSIEC